MAAVGGPIESVSIDSRSFSVAADADTNRKIGGDENEVEANGDKSGRIIKSAVPWMLDGLTLSVDDFLEDHEFLQGIVDKNDFSVIRWTYASGAVWQGNGTITGELQYSSANTTVPVTFKGTGKATQQ